MYQPSKSQNRILLVPWNLLAWLFPVKPMHLTLLLHTCPLSFSSFTLSSLYFCHYICIPKHCNTSFILCSNYIQNGSYCMCLRTCFFHSTLSLNTQANVCGSSSFILTSVPHFIDGMTHSWCTILLKTFSLDPGFYYYHYYKRCSMHIFVSPGISPGVDLLAQRGRSTLQCAANNFPKHLYPTVPLRTMCESCHRLDSSPTPGL